MFLITSRYASFLGFLYIYLTLRVIRYRRRHKISLGTGGDERLERLVLSHSNFSQFVPLGLILLALVECAGWPRLLLNCLGLSLCTGRWLHSLALPRASFRLRVAGMVLTIAPIICSSMLLGPFARSPRQQGVEPVRRAALKAPSSAAGHEVC